MNQQVQAIEAANQQWMAANPWAASRGLDESTWNALSSTIYPGSKPESILMAVDYCRARKLDIMLKPVHLVPMQVKDAQSGQRNWRDVPMPGVGLYRIQADRSGDYAGADEPEFGPTIEAEFEGQDYNKNSITVKVRYPEWCKYTVYKMIGSQRVSFKATEFWLENYATQSAKSEAPNAMWKKRPFGQLAKCAEAQALRKGWPEIGQEPTAEEMQGKGFSEVDITPDQNSQNHQPSRPALEYYPEESFNQNFGKWAQAIAAGVKTPDEVIKTVQQKGILTEEQQQKIREVAA